MDGSGPPGPGPVSQLRPAERAVIASGAVGDTGVQLTGRTGAIPVTATAPAGVADAGTQMKLLSVGASSQTQVPAMVASATPVMVTLGSNEQPKTPIVLNFDLSDQPQLYEKFTDTVRPVVLVNDEHTSDLLQPEWNPVSKVLTVTTDHLSTFTIIAADVGKSLTDAATQVWKTPAGGLDSPCEDKSELKVGSETVTLTPSTSGVIAACLRDTDTGIAVDFTSGSAQYYQVSADPVGQFTNGQPLAGSEQLAVALHGSAAGSGLLTPKGKGTVEFPPGTRSAQIRLDIDPAALQLATILTGLDMLGAGGDSLLYGFQSTKASYDCLITAYQSWTQPDDPSVAEFTEALGEIGQCGFAGAEVAAGNRDTHQILHRMSVATSLFTTLPAQLMANIAGIAGEFNGDNHLEFVLSSTAGSHNPPPIVTSSSNPPPIDASSSSPPSTSTAAEPGWYTLDEMEWLSWGNGSDCCSTQTITTTAYPESMTGYYQTGPNPGDDNNHVNLFLGGKCDQLDVFVGQSAESPGNTGNPGRFRVFLDDTRLAADNSIAINQDAIHLAIDLTGASRLKLQDDRHAADAINVWGTPRLHCATNPHPRR